MIAPYRPAARRPRAHGTPARSRATIPDVEVPGAAFLSPSVASACAAGDRIHGYFHAATCSRPAIGWGIDDRGDGRVVGDAHSISATPVSYGQRPSGFRLPDATRLGRFIYRSVISAGPSHSISRSSGCVSSRGGWFRDARAREDRGSTHRVGRTPLVRRRNRRVAFSGCYTSLFCCPIVRRSPSRVVRSHVGVTTIGRATDDRHRIAKW